ncbi:hypothetical protein [Volucribacter amazonae]|uniref:Uncharacterized protein n=1 Tax=Volucribacter amazonae TaxID=256731 RepID=A0A9X4SHF0_9PAST|nr:hypothetical protein [Volucribacter amazonae]MDG6894390.1 hypothetical protein [Volucribacter amazonae]
MEILFILGILFALPIILVVAFSFILIHWFSSLLPTLILAGVLTFITLALLGGLLVLPFKPVIAKYKRPIELFFNGITLLLFGPLILFLVISLVAFPFVMLFSLSDTPILWLVVILAYILINVIYHNRHKLWQ